MKRLVVTQPMFFPWVGMFEQIRLADILVNYPDVQFSKGSFTNRVQIKTQSGIKWLNVPLEKFSLGQKIDEVRISYATNWKENHISLLSEAFNQAPFKKDMIKVVESVYESNFTTIDELSFKSMTEICKYFDFLEGLELYDSRKLNIPGKGSSRVLQLAKSLGATDYITGHGAKNYLEHESFEQSGIDVSYIDYMKKPYEQLHGDFTPYVSILDLVAMKGKNGKDHIVSKTLNWREFLNGRD